MRVPIMQGLPKWIWGLTEILSILTTQLYVSSILSHQVGDRNLYFFTSGIIYQSADRTLRAYQSKTTKYLF